MRSPKLLSQINNQISGSKGFTLIETLIAGLLLTLVMSAIGRMSVSALAGSSNIADRRRIEEAIENHVQLVQQADSLLTYDNIPVAHRNGEESYGQVLLALHLQGAANHDGVTPMHAAHCRISR